MPLVRLGRQALPVFFAGMALAHAGGIAFALWGTGLGMQILVNVLGLGALYAVARLSAFVKNAPWKNPAPAAPRAAAPAPVRIPVAA